MQVYGSFPAVRMRRMRRDEFSRRLMREHVLTADDLIYPVFVIRARAGPKPSHPCPEFRAIRPIRSRRWRSRCLKLGVPVMALFPAIEPSLKTPDGKEATNPDGLIPRVVGMLKNAFPSSHHDRCCARPYTDHGQDGLVDSGGTSSTTTRSPYSRSKRLVQAAAGVDIVAPSDMMDAASAASGARWRRENSSTRASWLIRRNTPRILRTLPRCSRIGGGLGKSNKFTSRWTPPTATRRFGKWGLDLQEAQTW